jgi:hypothetical protein
MDSIHDFEDLLACLNRHRSRYLIVGGLDALLRIKERIDVPRHQEDARVLREVKRLRGD